MNSIARKELIRTKYKNKETIVNEIKSFNFDTKILLYLEDIFDDWEYAQEHGVYLNEDEISIIDVDECLDEINDRIDPKVLDCKERKIMAYLKKFIGFKIWV